MHKIRLAADYSREVIEKPSVIVHDDVTAGMWAM